MGSDEMVTTTNVPLSFQLKDSHFGASDVKACRICLATDVMMYSLEDTQLAICISNAGLDKLYEGLPNYVCYECAPCLLKMNKLLEKSRRAQAALLDIYTKNGQVTKNLIEEQNRCQLNLHSSLDSYLLLNYFHIQCDDDNKTSEIIKKEFDANEKIIKSEVKVESKIESSEELSKLKEEVLEIIAQSMEQDDNSDSDGDVELVETETPVVQVSDDENNDKCDDFISLKPYSVEMDHRAKGLMSKRHEKPIYNMSRKILRPKKLKLPKMTKKLKKAFKDSLCSMNPVETYDYLEKNFNIDKIPVQKTGDIKFSCKFCSKTFNNVGDATDHKLLGCTNLSGNNRNVVSASSSKSSQPQWEEWTPDK